MKKLEKHAKDFSVKNIIAIVLASIFIISSTIIIALPVFSGGTYPGDGKGAATIYVTPQYNNFTHPPTNINDVFTVYVRIKDYTFVAGWQVKLEFDRRYLNITAANVTYASDLVFPPGTYPPIPVSVGNVFGNATHAYVMMTTTTYGAVEYNGTDAGLMEIRFKIIAVPPDGEVYSSILGYNADDTWTIDTDLIDNTETDIDGYYQIRTPLILPYLAIDSKIMPAIPGDRVIGDHFKLDINIFDVPESRHIILVQYVITYDPDYLKLIWIWEGTFMNNSVWAPYGTFNNVTLKDHEGYVSTFILVNPNFTTGEWDWGEFTEGDGLLAQVEFEVTGQPKTPGVVTTDVNVEGVFDEFFVTAEEEYAPYNPPMNGEFTISEYDWDYPVADFMYAPSLPEVDEMITFDASASFGYRNVDGTLVQDADMITSYIWDFGDANSTTTSQPTIVHSYPDLDIYTVNLTVIDEYGENDTMLKVVNVVEILIHPITYQTETFYVQTISNGKILPVPMYFSQPKRLLYFNITGPDGANGFINITIPNRLLSAGTGEWTVIAGGKMIEPLVVVVNVTHTMLHIPMTFSTQNVYIHGTGVIPEYPINSVTLIMLGLFFAAATIIAFSLQKKRKLPLK